MHVAILLFLYWCVLLLTSSFFFFNDTATTEIYTLSLHDALPISSPWARSRRAPSQPPSPCSPTGSGTSPAPATAARDRKSTRLNSSHLVISYAVFCLKKKKITNNETKESADREKSIYTSIAAKTR